MATHYPTPLTNRDCSSYSAVKPLYYSITREVKYPIIRLYRTHGSRAVSQHMATNSGPLHALSSARRCFGKRRSYDDLKFKLLKGTLSYLYKHLWCNMHPAQQATNMRMIGQQFSCAEAKSKRTYGSYWLLTEPMNRLKVGLAATRVPGRFGHLSQTGCCTF